MEENKYRLAGWLAIIQAVLFPMAIVWSIVEAGIAGRFFGVHRPFIGPSDFLMYIHTLIAIYTLLKFKKLLNERYSFSELDLLIMISVGWLVAFQVIGFVLGVFAMVYWPVDKIVMAVVYFSFFTGAMVSIGIVDIMIAVKLLKIKENFSEHIRGLAYVTMAAGICEVTVLLSPFSLLLVPVTAVILALIFFRDQHEVEFV